MFGTTCKGAVLKIRYLWWVFYGWIHKIVQYLSFLQTCETWIKHLGQECSTNLCDYNYNFRYHFTTKGENITCTKTWMPGSLTHWKKWYPSLFSSLKINPFLQQNTDFSAQSDRFFVIIHRLFGPKWTPFFAVKHWLFSPNEPLFHSKTLDIKITPFFSKFMEVSTKIPPFSRKMRILDFLKKYPFIHEFYN